MSEIDDYLADNPESQSSWFELSNTETWIGVDVDMPVVSELLYAKAEIARYGFESLWDVGNMEKVEGETLAEIRRRRGPLSRATGGYHHSAGVGAVG